MTDVDEVLTRSAASDAVESIGWRYLLGALATSVAVTSMAEGLSVAAAAVGACRPDTDEHLRVDIRSTRVELSLRSWMRAALTARDVELAHLVSDAVHELGLETAGAPAPATLVGRPVQALEIAIDTMDSALIRPFWKAVLGYEDEPGHGGPDDAVLDAAGQGPTIWFQQLDEPRPQRNRIHFDITVAHDEADARVAAALANGGRLVSDEEARSFWILADADGNEVCVCTWQDRD